ncbi:MAG: SDR family NAD(P)-dependent oxidoreductase [Burkholderiales bacterium]|nr:SDR family NAD(P)-dependent oxidoreductase [Burkholderiales bacterium]
MNLPPADALAPGAAPLAAVTGATGFIGRHLVVALHRAGFRVRLLLRREPDVAEWRELVPEVVAGSLGDAAALARLVEGADVVIHLAGLIKAARRADFFAVNRDGAAALARAVEHGAPVARFLLVSSLAAREPALSDYAASKHAGERAVREILGARATVLRPSVVYGPGDRETLLFFQLAAGRLVPLLGRAEARAALIHVSDLVRLMVALASEPAGHAGVLEAADERPRGYTWEELLGAAARAVGNATPRFVRAPQALLSGVALVGDLAKTWGSSSMISSQKLRELRHPDWGVAAAERATAPGWAAQFDLEHGFADAVAWYRRAGWLAAA